MVTLLDSLWLSSMARGALAILADVCRTSWYLLYLSYHPGHLRLYSLFTSCRPLAFACVPALRYFTSLLR